MSEFKGSFISTLDAKGRVAVPAKLRRHPDSGPADRFVITLGLNGCLFLFPPDHWAEVMRKIAALPFTQQKTLYFTRKLMSNADDVELDRQARIRIPQGLLAQAGLEREVKFVGAIQRIELWRPETFDQQINSYESDNNTSYENVAEELLL
jgi:MraZ protein